MFRGRGRCSFPATTTNEQRSVGQRADLEHTVLLLVVRQPEMLRGAIGSDGVRASRLRSIIVAY